MLTFFDDKKENLHDERGAIKHLTSHGNKLSQ